MSKPIDDGGPAFPHVYANGEYVTDQGMTLRDYFAAKVLQGLSSYPDNSSWNPTAEPDVEAWRAGLKKRDAEYCYSMADAMIAARKKHE